jgi:hypothetical protein
VKLVEKALSVENMKMRTISLTPKFLVEALQGKTESFVTNLPSDAQLLDMKFDLCNNQVLAVIRSDSFKDIAELYPIPELKLDYSAATKAVAVTTPTTKLDAKLASAKPAPETEKQAQPRLIASKLEQEFTPEQRKLLNFKTEGDCVIVKPIQFLKGEWEDINDVVKSLGGKWVKGDIISYWEIPLE